MSIPIRRRTDAKLAIFLPSLAGGGVARMALDLGGELSARGFPLDLVICQSRGELRNSVPPRIRVVELRRGSRLAARALALRADPSGIAALLRPILACASPPPPLPYLRALVRYLQEAQPCALLSAKTHTNLVALWARELAGVGTRIVISEHTPLSQQIASERRRKARWRYVAPLVMRTYPRADGIVAISRYVANDLAPLAGVPLQRVDTVYNPSCPTSWVVAAGERFEHAWFASGSPDVVLAAGRLDYDKDFETLLRAFAIVRKQRDVRLVILGEGRLRNRLLSAARDLDIASSVDLPGFVENPCAYMARARVFVLSSRYEGFANVVVEALSRGCPVVATDCGGPAEILEDGRYGRLVPVGDARAMAAAIGETLDELRVPEVLEERATYFSLDRAADKYLRVMLGNGDDGLPIWNA